MIIPPALPGRILVGEQIVMLVFSRYIHHEVGINKNVFEMRQAKNSRGANSSSHAPDQHKLAHLKNEKKIPYLSKKRANFRLVEVASGASRLTLVPKENKHFPCYGLYARVVVLGSVLVSSSISFRW